MKTIMIMMLSIHLNNVVKIKDYPFIQLNRATTYFCNVRQCNNDPFTTADGSVIDVDKLKRNEIRWCALSRDLIWDDHRQTIHSEGFRGFYRFGDTITVYSKTNPQINGEWVVHDTMNKRYTKSIDFLVHPLNDKTKLGICEDVILYKPKQR
jgi:hypothetical protein